MKQTQSHFLCFLKATLLKKKKNIRVESYNKKNSIIFSKLGFGICCAASKPSSSSFMFYRKKKIRTLKSITTLSSPTFKRSITAESLRKLSRFYCGDASIIILSTSYGLLTHWEALNKNIGGILLFRVKC